MNLNLATTMTIVTFAFVAIVGTAAALAIRIALGSMHTDEHDAPQEQSRVQREASDIVYACWTEEVQG